MFAYETPFGFVGVRMAKTIGVNDGWMGASLTFEGLREITLDKPLHLRYGLYIHSDMKSADAIEAMWKRFSRMQEP